MSMSASSQSIPLFLFLGQSYFGMNSNNGRVLCPPETNPTRMLVGAHGLHGADHTPLQAPYTGLAPAADSGRKVQSPIAPFLYRYAARAASQGLPSSCIGHAVSRSNGSVSHLLPPAHHWHLESAVFENLMAAISATVAFTTKEDRNVFVPALFFCQGTGDRTMGKEDYLLRLNSLFDILAKEICACTGQEAPPHFFIVQPPAKVAGGRWPCLQALNEISETRIDCTLAIAGWAVPQHDRTHFSGVGCVALGELCAEVYLAHERGDDLSAPRITKVAREGSKLLATVGGAGSIIIDDGPNTPRHRVNDQPLQHHGLQLDQGEIDSVRIRGNELHITLTKGCTNPNWLYFAYATPSSLGIKRIKIKANQSVNRGNIRADRAHQSLFLADPLYQWMASSCHTITSK